jgi:hypothetical protein
VMLPDLLLSFEKPSTFCRRHLAAEIGVSEASEIVYL